MIQHLVDGLNGLISEVIITHYYNRQRRETDNTVTNTELSPESKLILYTNVSESEVTKNSVTAVIPKVLAIKKEILAFFISNILI